mgnify:CR=1 FL=1
MARVTKKDIYKSYGIEFDGDHIISPLGPVSPLLINGNDKIGKGVYHFSTVPGTKLYDIMINNMSFTVKGTCPCDCIGCYAMSGNYTRYGYDGPGMRTVIARDYLDFMQRAVIAQIKADHIKLVRIHASGDFFSIDYINAWREIVKACPEVIFWTYTKNKAAENAFADLVNINIVKSVIPGKGVNYGHCDYIIACYEFLKNAGKDVYICRCGIDKNQHCVNCKGCSRNEYVLFIEHSTEYKAEKDPLFPVLKAIIESQPSQDANIADPAAA